MSKHIHIIDSKLSRSLYAINRSRYLVPPKSGADPGGGGVQGSKDPPGPQRWGPGPLFQNEENSIFYLFYLLSCYNASEQLSGHQISKFSWGAYSAKPPAAYGSLRSPLPPATSRLISI